MDTEQEENLLEKKEQIVNSYCILFDKELAYQKCDVTEEEKILLDNDIAFQSRLTFFLIQEREAIVTNLRNMRSSLHEPTALKATLELGKILYSKVFSVTDTNKMEVILPIETQKKLKALFESGSVEDWKGKIKDKLMKEGITSEEDLIEQ